MSFNSYIESLVLTLQRKVLLEKNGPNVRAWAFELFITTQNPSGLGLSRPPFASLLARAVFVDGTVFTLGLASSRAF